MRTSQDTLENKVEYCEHSKPLDSNFVCELTSFGFVWRCTLADKKTCPDLEYFRKQKQGRKRP